MSQLSDLLFLFQNKAKAAIKLNFRDVIAIDSLKPDYQDQTVELSLNHNQLKTLEGIEQFRNLRKLHVTFNKLESVNEFERISEPYHIEELSIKGNPFKQSDKDIQRFLKTLFKNMRVFNGDPVEERIIQIKPPTKNGVQRSTSQIAPSAQTSFTHRAESHINICSEASKPLKTFHKVSTPQDKKLKVVNISTSASPYIPPPQALFDGNQVTKFSSNHRQDHSTEVLLTEQMPDTLTLLDNHGHFGYNSWDNRSSSAVKGKVAVEEAYFSGQTFLPRVNLQRDGSTSSLNSIGSGTSVYNQVRNSKHKDAYLKQTIEIFQSNLGKTLEFDEKLDMMQRKKDLTFLYKILLQWRHLAKTTKEKAMMKDFAKKAPHKIKERMTRLLENLMYKTKSMQSYYFKQWRQKTELTKVPVYSSRCDTSSLYGTGQKSKRKVAFAFENSSPTRKCVKNVLLQKNKPFLKEVLKAWSYYVQYKHMQRVKRLNLRHFAEQDLVQTNLLSVRSSSTQKKQTTSVKKVKSKGKENMMLPPQAPTPNSKRPTSGKKKTTVKKPMVVESAVKSKPVRPASATVLRPSQSSTKKKRTPSLSGIPKPKATR